MVDVSVIERMIEQGRDSYEARLAVGQAHLKQGQFDRAIEHLAKACEMSPQKTVAWQALGQAHVKNDQPDLARESWQQGIEVAKANGDQQAEKVMAVWLKRLG
ncbi:MAG TPA: tetratricopeptide repeat protein [Wenzhouxiangella sp.]